MLRHGIATPRWSRALLSIQDARRIVLEAARARAATERVLVQQAAGRRLAVDLRADGDLPPFDRVTMDGFAVRAAETQGGNALLPVDGETAAGDGAGRPLAAGRARSIMTGASLPPGADAVVQVEWTELRGDDVLIRRAVAPGQNVAPRGEDLRSGTVAMTAGEAVTALSLSLLVACGPAEVEVGRRPGLALLASGNELVPAGSRLAPGQIRESNGVALAALLSPLCRRVVKGGIVPDERVALRQRLEEASAEDVVVLTGGASVGRYDYSAEVAEGLGFQRLFDQVAVRPGKPTLFFTRGRTLLFCLPGNPVAALMTGRVLVGAALAALAGEPVEEWPSLALPLAAPVRRNPARDLLVPVTLQQGRISFAGWNGSGDLVCMRSAQGFAHVGRGAGEAPAGELVTLFPTTGGGTW